MCIEIARSPSILTVTISEQTSCLNMVSVYKCWKCCTLNIFEYETSALRFPPVLFFPIPFIIVTGRHETWSVRLDLLQIWSLLCMYWSLLLLQKSLEVWQLQCFHPCSESMLSCKAVYQHSFHHICIGNIAIHLSSASATQMDFISSCGKTRKTKWRNLLQRNVITFSA